MNNAIDLLVQLIQGAGGHRFRKLNCTKINNEYYYYYSCSQDSERCKKSISLGIRDQRRMERFKCQSNLKLQANLSNRRLELQFQHDYHSPYLDIRLSLEAIEFVKLRCSGHTPAEIFRDLQSSGISGADMIVQHQIYYQWQCANSSIWRRDLDQFTSANKLLIESGNKYQHAVFKEGNLRGLAIYIRSSMSVLVSKAKELVIDATFGTNNSGVKLMEYFFKRDTNLNHLGMGLSAVLAELDGTGVPLCYLFLGVNPLDQASQSAVPSATTRILEQFLQPLKDAGYEPSFFGCDKDRAEISAIRRIWPSTTIQLCFWHAKRAIRKKLSDSKKTSTQKHYFPEKAKNLVTSLEICWGSYSTCRPDGEHRYNRCQCNSSSRSFDELGRLETDSVAERETVLRMFSRHFNMHPMIPDQNGTYRSARQIHLDCINEAYSWCHSRNYFRLWAYLYVNWYSTEQWELWARSANPDFLPVLKTTMIIESHWRRIKHDYLHRFSRPRIDLVIWVLISRVLPTALERMNAILSKNHRNAAAAWRKAFKREWNHLQSIQVDSHSLARHYTDPSKWTCACEKFLLSRFLLCEHVISCFEKVSNKIQFFSEVRRQRYSPFWIEKQLVLRPEHRTQDTVILSVDESAFISDNDPNELLEDTENEELDISQDTDEEEDELEVSNDENLETDEEDIISSTDSLIDLVREQITLGNTKFLKEFMKSNIPNATLLREIQQKKRSRTMAKTWSSNKHPGTMYYR